MKAKRHSENVGIPVVTDKPEITVAEAVKDPQKWLTGYAVANPKLKYFCTRSAVSRATDGLVT